MKKETRADHLQNQKPPAGMCTELSPPHLPQNYLFRNSVEIKQVSKCGQEEKDED